jgi:hypothetical protein
MGTTYVVVEGDTLTTIAADHGFADWRTIWNDPANASLRARRPDPDQIFAGDQVFIPDNPDAPTITIRVADDDDGCGPLAGATVEITGILRELTDASGSFRTTRLKTGVAYDLKVSRDGFRCMHRDTGIFWYHDWSSLPASGEQSLRQPVKDASGNDTSTFGIVFTSSRTSYDVKLRREWRSIAVAAAPGGKVTVDACVNEAEVVLVAGSDEHERTFGNGMRFPAQAVRELREKYASEKHVAVVLFTNGYTDAMVTAVERSAAKWNPAAVLVRVTSTAELMNYINSGATAGGAHRHQADHGMPIKVLTFFSHGFASTFRFDMGGKDDTRCSLGLDSVASFDITSFLPDVAVVAYSCRIGNSSPNELKQANDWRAEARPENSLAQKLAEQLKVVVHAYVLRTEYAATWQQDNDASVISGNQKFSDTLPHQGFHPRDDGSHVLWNDEGAHHRVVGGTSPGYLNNPDSRGRFKFTPGAPPAQDGDP